MRGTDLFHRRIMARAFRVAAPLLAFMVAACALPQDISLGEKWGRARLETGGVQDGIRRCAQAFSIIDNAVGRAGTGDAQATSIAGFPHLRTTRFLAALGARFRTANNKTAFADWTEWLARTAAEGRGYELANLSAAARDALQSRLGEKPEAVVADCTAVLLQFDGTRSDFRETLVATAAVPDNYADMFRVIGIYPLTSLPVLFGFNRWKDRNLPGFRNSPSALKMSGKIGFSAPGAVPLPMTPKAISALLRGWSGNPLKIPRPGDAELRRLAAGFAPVFAVDVTGDYDRIGVPVLRVDGPPQVDTSAPQVYVQPSWTLIGGAPHLQISYLAWFSERPPTGSLDILAGKLDGLIWRVTISPDGRPMLYDSIHPCGCYHLFFPVPPTRLKTTQTDEPREGTVVPTDAPVLAPGQRMVLHISSGDHYLRGLSVSNGLTAGSTPYELVSMDALRSLPAPGGGRRSLYERDGLVAGTERDERWVLWPMGISSPGAMRQWGTHATAFVGRRHFDDPYLIDKAFTR